MFENMKITTLIDNLTYGKNFVGEHGLSILIENDKKKILFDTGQSGNFIKNANLLGIDISDIDSVVISHGHYDHCGGIMEFVKYNKKAKIYIKKEAFYNKYKIKKYNGEKIDTENAVTKDIDTENIDTKDIDINYVGINDINNEKKAKEDEVKEFIGIPFNKSLIEERIVYTDNELFISDNINIISNIKIYDEFDTHFEGMFVEIDGKIYQDEFYDEQFLVINHNDRLILISGCSHRGISNIVRNAINKYKLPIDYLIGGFHLMNENQIKVEKTINLLNGLNIKNIGVSHCSGIESLALIKSLIKTNLFYNYTGNIIVI